MDSYRALIIDDDALLLHVLSRHLERAGYVVETTTDPHEALRSIEQNCPHFLITDWQMPQVDGIELCRRVRHMGLHQYVYIIFLTCRDGSDDLIQALDAGADEFVTKPLRESVLLARMQAGKRLLQLEQRLAEMASQDQLTGLPARQVLDDYLQKELYRSQRHRLPLSCVMIDIDFFKHVNDTIGHRAGDQVLLEVAGTLQDCARKSDVVCRYGGEEFCAVLPETHETEAAAWAERARQRIQQLGLSTGGQVVRVTASFGVAECLAEMEESHDLIDLADQALLAAKRAGRDRVVRFSDFSSEEALEKERASDVLTGVVARDAMTAIIAPLERSTTVRQAVDLFLEFRVSAAPVVDEAGQLVGIVTEKDMVAAADDPDASLKCVGEIMRTNVVAYDEQTPLRRIYDFLRRVSIRSVIVVDDGRPTGIIGRHTILRWYLNYVWPHPTVRKHQGHRAVGETHRDSDAIAACQQLAHQACELRDLMSQTLLDDRTVPLVAGASRMQELLNDLLASSGYASSKSPW